MEFEVNCTVPKMVRAVSEKYPEVVAQYSKNKAGDFEGITYRNLFQKAMDFGAALLSLGVKENSQLVLFLITVQNGSMQTLVLCLLVQSMFLVVVMQHW